MGGTVAGTAGHRATCLLARMAKSGNLEAKQFSESETR